MIKARNSSPSAFSRGIAHDFNTCFGDRGYLSLIEVQVSPDEIGALLSKPGKRSSARRI